MSATNCPTIEQLNAYSSGCLTAEAIDAITEHLPRCSSCISTLEQLDPSDALIEAFRAQANQSKLLADGEQIEQIMKAAKQFFGYAKHGSA